MKRILLIAGGAIMIIIIAILTLGSRTKKPPEIASQNIPDQQDAFIAMPIAVAATDVERIIRANLQSPLLSGVTPEIDAKLLATEPISTEQLVKELVSPYMPGRLVDDVKIEYRTVSESFFCALTPWKWGQCWRSVLKPFEVPFKRYIEPQAAVYRYTSKKVTDIVDKVYDVGAWVHYDTFLDDLKISFNGNAITINASTNTKLVFDYKQPTVPLGPNVTIKGLMRCEIKNEITLAGTVSISDSMELDVNIVSDDTRFAFKEACLPFAVEGIDLASYLDPAFLATKAGITKIAHDAIVKAINKKIDDKESGLHLKDHIKTALSSANEPRMIYPDLWLIPGIKTCMISDLTSYSSNGISFLQINLALKSNPQFSFSHATPQTDSGSFTIVKGTSNPVVHARFKGELDYETVSKTLSDSLNGFLRRTIPKFLHGSSAVRIYTSNANVVLGVSLQAGAAGKLIELFLWGIPKFDSSSNTFWIDSLDYYSKNLVVQAIDKVESANILNFLRKKSRWSIDEQMKAALSKFKEINQTTDVGLFTGSLQRLAISNVFAQTDRLSVFVELDGQLSFQVRPLKFLVLNDSGSVNADVVSGFESVTLPADSSLANRAAVIPKNLKVSIYTPGDSVFVLEQGKYALKPITFKEKSLPGDSIFYLDKSGAERLYIVTPEDLKVPMKK